MAVGGPGSQLTSCRILPSATAVSCRILRESRPHLLAVSHPALACIALLHQNERQFETSSREEETKLQEEATAGPVNFRQKNPCIRSPAVSFPPQLSLPGLRRAARRRRW
ncbi:hypothetical protein NDU88_004262 [Pleurodeles waltl]|uniref:Uncharacterized protein n=1 Tax=Pleurodeles waltl TaxID=8319 RepID=A0AAV7NNU7_PLEWA|nr:hypothetical protein NDU88_004262 [Pleurodeles waltl]